MICNVLYFIKIRKIKKVKIVPGLYGPSVFAFVRNDDGFAMYGTDELAPAAAVAHVGVHGGLVISFAGDRFMLAGRYTVQAGLARRGIDPRVAGVRIDLCGPDLDLVVGYPDDRAVRTDVPAEAAKIAFALVIIEQRRIELIQAFIQAGQDDDAGRAYSGAALASHAGRVELFFHKRAGRPQERLFVRDGGLDSFCEREHPEHPACDQERSPRLGNDLCIRRLSLRLRGDVYDAPGVMWRHSEADHMVRAFALTLKAFYACRRVPFQVFGDRAHIARFPAFHAVPAPGVDLELKGRKH